MNRMVWDILIVLINLYIILVYYLKIKLDFEEFEKMAY